MHWSIGQPPFKAIILLSLFGATFQEQVSNVYVGPEILNKFAGAPTQPYAREIINLHQPLNMPGFMQSPFMNTMMMTPPPAQVLHSSLIPPSALYLSEERPIQTEVNVVQHAQQLRNPFNQYSMWTRYDPYAGPSAPGNEGHPFNRIYGSSPAAIASGYGRPNYSGLGGSGQLVGQFAPDGSMSPQLGIPAMGAFASPYQAGNPGMGAYGSMYAGSNQNYGPFSTGQDYNVFHAETGPFGHMSMYNTAARKLASHKRRGKTARRNAKKLAMAPQEFYEEAPEWTSQRLADYNLRNLI